MFVIDRLRYIRLMKKSEIFQHLYYGKCQSFSWNRNKKLKLNIF